VMRTMDSSTISCASPARRLSHACSTESPPRARLTRTNRGTQAREDATIGDSVCNDLRVLQQTARSATLIVRLCIATQPRKIMCRATVTFYTNERMA
jgi:hypothetical protein